MGVQGVALEDHGDIAVFGGHVVDDLAVNEQLAFADLLQTGHHAQGGGLSAAGGADQNDELLIRDVQVELLHRDHAFVGDLQVGLLYRSVPGLLLFLLVIAAVGIDLLDAFQGNSCHVPGVSENASAILTSAGRSGAAKPLRQVSTLPHRTPTRVTSFLVSLPRHFCGVAGQLVI